MAADVTAEGGKTGKDINGEKTSTDDRSTDTQSMLRLQVACSGWTDNTLWLVYETNILCNHLVAV